MKRFSKCLQIVSNRNINTVSILSNYTVYFYLIILNTRIRVITAVPDFSDGVSWDFFYFLHTHIPYNIRSIFQNPDMAFFTICYYIM